MGKNRKSKKAKPQANRPAPAVVSDRWANGEGDEIGSVRPWSPTVKCFVSIALALHLAAIIMAPLAFLLPPLRTVNRVFAPYQQATYTGHGYQFFAPDPGPNHHVGYRVTLADGQEVKGRFPDRDKIWPRLYYHRWFMLAERTYSIHDAIMTNEESAAMKREIKQQIDAAKINGNPTAARELASQLEFEIENQQQLKHQSQRLTQAVDRWLRQKHPDAVDVEIWCGERLIPLPYQVTDEHKRLDDEQFLPADRRHPMVPAEEI